MNIIISFFARILNMLFPEVCAGCGKEGTLLCAPCLASLPKASEAEYPFINALFSYRGSAIRQLIWRLKYKNAKRVAYCFGKSLYDGILGEIAENLHLSKTETFLLIPIPLHKSRERERGYNQSELLAKEILRHDTGKIFRMETKALTRIHATKAQAKSEKRTARFENLHGAFSANKTLVKNKHVILIDDVTTTGATFSEARKALLRAGAKSVSAWAVAH